MFQASFRHRVGPVMNKILVIAQSEDLAKWVSEAFPPNVKLITRRSFGECLPLLENRFVDFVCYATDSNHVQSAWDIEKLRQDYPAIPLAVVADCDDWEWESENYAQGVLFVFRRPLDLAMARTLLARILKVREAISGDSDGESDQPAYHAAESIAPTVSRSPDSNISPSFRALQVVRDFSQSWPIHSPKSHSSRSCYPSLRKSSGSIVLCSLSEGRE